MSLLTQEQAAALAAHKIETIRRTLVEICQLADEYELDVQILNEWDNKVYYSGRPYLDEYCEMRADGGWCSSHC
jgi:hypothetical protein